MSQQPPQSNVPQPNRQGELQLELPANLDAAYSNLAVIQHSPAEFILDFARYLPNTPAARVGARVVMTPMHTKQLLRALQENIEKFEAQFGPIYVPKNDGGQFAAGLFNSGKPPQK
jgi:hypothetical protein